MLDLFVDNNNNKIATAKTLVMQEYTRASIAFSFTQERVGQNVEEGMGSHSPHNNNPNDDVASCDQSFVGTKFHSCYISTSTLSHVRE